MGALQAWAERQIHCHDAVAVGLFGSYARGDWGVGSDLDLVVIRRTSDLPFVERARQHDTADLPVPADLLVYTAAEWRQLERADRRIVGEVRWVAGELP